MDAVDMSQIMMKDAPLWPLASLPCTTMSSTIPVSFILLRHDLGCQYEWVIVHTVNRAPTDSLSSLGPRIKEALQAEGANVLAGLESKFYLVCPPA